MSTARANPGHARTRTIGWGDRAVVFTCVDHQVEGVTAKGIPYRTAIPRWEAQRGDRRAAVQPADIFSWMVILDEEDGTVVTRRESLEDALHVAREFLLGGAA